MAAINPSHLVEGKKLQIVFDKFDKDGGGTIDASEIKQIFESKKLNLNDDDWDALNKAFHTGSLEELDITIDQFKEVMKRLLVEVYTDGTYAK